MSEYGSPTWQAASSIDSFVHLQLLNGGSFIASTDKLHHGVKNDKFRLYNWAFYINHPVLDRHILWDVGLTNNKTDYTPFVHNAMFDAIIPASPSKSIEQQLLQRSGVAAERVDAVVFSHAHFDHCRPIRNIFPLATGYFGPGTRDYCSPGHFCEPNVQWDGRFFDPKSATENWEELDGPWKEFGPFEKAMDFFGDGSFWVIQAPGHMPGNLCAAARLENGEWVVLGSDCCHSRDLFDGKYDFAVFPSPDGGQACLHLDVPAARETLAKLRILEGELKMHIAFAHDAVWLTQGSDPVLMSLLDEGMKKAARDQIPFDQAI